MKEIAFVEQILREAGAYVRARYGDRGSYGVSTKTDPNDLLTEVDIAAQERIAAAVHAAFPGDIVVGEESGRHRFPEDPACRCWVVDPIDGTQNFVRGIYPTFGMSLAFAEGGQVRAGGVYMPVTGDLFLGARGQGATRNGSPVQASRVSDVTLARVEVDLAPLGGRAEAMARARRLMASAGQLRCHATAVGALAAIASGDADAYFHIALSPWDYAAGWLLVEEAGGVVTRLDGSPMALFDGGRGMLAAASGLHGVLLALIEG